MDRQNIEALVALNNRFYTRQAASFSRSRQTAWAGWARIAEILRQQPWMGEGRDVTLFDLACGNCRFERFVAGEFPQTSWDFFALDACEELLREGVEALAADVGEGDGGRISVQTRTLDILQTLLDTEAAEPDLGVPPCDLAVSFGFLHHVPTQELRAQVLHLLLEQVEPGGLVAVTLWRPLRSESLARKAEEVYPAAIESLQRLEPVFDAAQLEEGDCFLGWGEGSEEEAPDDEGAYRYCHHFSDAEVEELIEDAHPVELIERFDADGRGGNLNTYLIFQR